MYDKLMKLVDNFQSQKKIQYHPTFQKCAPYPVGENVGLWISLIHHYIDAILDNLIRKQDYTPFIGLMCRGSSGAIIAALISAELTKMGYNVVINHVKKDGESSHSYNVPTINDDPEHACYFIVDDLISSGSTLQAIAAAYPDTTFKAAIVIEYMHCGKPSLEFVNNNVEKLYF